MGQTLMYVEPAIDRVDLRELGRPDARSGPTSELANKASPRHIYLQ
jgi:hypothetical protein